MAKKAKKAARRAPARKAATRKAATRKPAARKAAARKPAARKAATKKPARITAASKPRTKGEIYNLIAGQTELSRKQVVSVFDALSGVLAADLGRRGPGICNIPGLAKVVVQRKPATKARKGINPFTGEQTVFKAKPARNVVKVRPLKNLKSMV
jgi:nucleoid DNA-binding protein